MSKLPGWLVHRLERRRVRAEAIRLRQSTAAQAHTLAAVLDNALSGPLAPEEIRLIDRIEALRRELAASDTAMVKTDYGAGKGTPGRSPEQMARGVVSTTTVARAMRASKSQFWAALLFRLIRAYRPSSCVELGACLGISAAYQGCALSLDGDGRLATLEGDPALAAMAADHLSRLGLNQVEVVPGRFQDTLDGVLARYRPVDYAFIDGHHDGRATIAYFEQFQPHLAQPALLVFDDIRPAGMQQAWRQIRTATAVRVHVDLGQLGICVFGS